jgi:ABC-type antimicrobial peptide transport system permease subunit
MGLLYSLGRDLRFALRQMRQTPIVSGVALLSLALGIGANVAIFSLVNALILKSYSVTRRKNEIGIRMALGAEPDKVVRLVLKHVAFITVVGLVAGAAGAVATGRFINALLFNLAASDKTMIVITAVTLVAAAAVAGYLPPRRAARIDPMTALREE